MASSLLTKPAINRTAREHVGTVRSIRWSDPSTGFVIATLDDGSTIKGGNASEVVEVKQCYRFLGRWIEDPKYGPQFRFDTFAIRVPATRVATIRYLAKLCDGIGERTAEKLWDKYGPDTVQRLRTDPDEFVDNDLLDAKTAAQASRVLTKESKNEATKLELFDLLSNRGFQIDKLIAECITKWGADSPAKIRRNPFALMVAEFPGCGFKRTDKLYCDLGLPRASLKRQMFAAWNFIHTDCSGNTWLPIQSGVAAVRSLIGGQCEPELAIRLGIRARWIRYRRDEQGKLWITEKHRAGNEQIVADGIANMRKHGVPDWPAVVASSDGLSDHQSAAAATFRNSTIALLIGTPGTGKTYTAAKIIKQIIASHGVDNVAVMAPTGKAAVRCTQAMRSNDVEIIATTIHRKLKIGGTDVRNDSPKMLSERFIIVDESSMLDTDLFARLIESIPETSHLLLIGDPYQLPPVGHGAPLRDMIAAGVPCGELSEIRRNAGLIVRACAAIKNGQPFEVADKYEPENGMNLRHFESATDKESIESLESLLQRFSESKLFDPIWRTQVLVAVNDKGGLNRKLLNTRLQNLLNHDGRAVPTHPFRVGDKVICLKNGQYPRSFASPDPAADATDASNYRDKPLVQLPSQSTAEQLYIANGEIGEVLAINPNLFIARFSDSDSLVKVIVSKSKASDTDTDTGTASQSESESKGSGCNFDLAYAITTHKSQGSESPCIVVMIDKTGDRVAAREWHYTAISRASQLCITIGKRSVLDCQARRVTLDRRKTFLAELIEANGQG